MTYIIQPGDSVAILLNPGVMRHGWEIPFKRPAIYFIPSGGVTYELQEVELDGHIQNVFVQLGCSPEHAKFMLAAWVASTGTSRKASLERSRPGAESPPPDSHT